MSSNPSGADLRRALDAVAAFIPRYVVLPSAEAVDALALWAAVTHCITERWPQLLGPLIVTSPEKRSGKTRVLDVLEPMTAKPWRIGCAPSPATLYRVEDQVTCLLDEVDRVFGRAQENDLLISIINDGIRRGAEVRRCDEKNQVRVFSAFAPRVLCGIDAGRWPDTVTDRSIIIKLTRKPPTQLVEDWEGFVAETHETSYSQALRLGEALAALAPLGELAGRHRIERLLELDDRANDGWNPLRQLAEVAGGHWPERARLAAITLSAERGDEDTLKATLLRDLRELFGDRAQVPTAELIDGLLGLEESPWGKVGRGGMDPNILARMLRSFGVRSKTIRQGEVTCKGYTAADLAPIFSAYLAPPLNSRHAVTSNNGGARAVTPSGPAVTQFPTTAGADGDVTALRHIGGDEGPPAAQSLRERAAGFLVLAEEEVER